MTLRELLIGWKVVLKFWDHAFMRKAGVSKGSANGVSRKLAGIDILNREKKGIMFFYRLNTKNPVTKGLEVLCNIWVSKDW